MFSRRRRRRRNNNCLISFREEMNVLSDEQISKSLILVLQHSIGNIIQQLFPHDIIVHQKSFSNQDGHNHVMFGVLVVFFSNSISDLRSFKYVQKNRCSIKQRFEQQRRFTSPTEHFLQEKPTDRKIFHRSEIHRLSID